MTLPGWPPRDWRALLALAASVAAAAVLTGLAAWIVWILWRGGWSAASEPARVDALARSLFGTLMIIGIVLVSLGLAINKRSVSASLLGASFQAEGGDDDAEPALPAPAPPPGTASVTTTTTVAAPSKD